MKLTRLASGIVLAIGYGFLAVIPPSMANNIMVTNVTLVNQDSSGMMDVKFDLRWDNSWRIADPSCTNWDAAWVFVKFWGSNGWQHATLGTTSGQHHPAANSTIEAVPDGKGVFVYRSGPYTGAVDYAGTRVRWNYAADGYNFYAGAAVTVSVHAVEMVYVTQGPFYAGNMGGDLDGSFRSQADQNAPINITNADAFTVCWGTGSGTSTSVPAAFPNGYNAFYCMKYEITQWQYMTFLNELTRVQQNGRTASQVATNFAMSATPYLYYRSGIRCPAVIPPGSTNIVFGCDGNSDMVFNGANDGQNWACDFLSWGDGIAYADWAGLRPMTELEYVKACRGPLPAVYGEYAWGDATRQTIGAEVGTPGSGTETSATPGANCNNNYDCGVYPSRVGIFATANSTRRESGATYWGIMEMSVNVAERCITVGNSVGLAFTGVHGDGQLTSAGEADSFAMSWPLFDGVGAGIMARPWNNDWDQSPRIAKRQWAATADQARSAVFGFRCVRTAP